MLAMVAVVSSQCQLGWTSFAGNCYHVSVSPMTALEGRTYCRQKKSFLADVESQFENDFIVSLAAGSSYLIIGLTDEQTEGLWRWPRTNTAASYTNWYIPGEPASPGTGEAESADCVEISLLGSRRGYWNDVTCSVNHSVVCKHGPDLIVNCNSHTMGYTIRKDYLGYQSANGLSLTNASCQPTDASDSLTQSWPLSQCGTAILQAGNQTVYTNTLKLSTGNALISRSDDNKLTVSCSFDNNGFITAGALQPGFHKQTASVDGLGSYTVRLDVTDSSYSSNILSFPHQVRLEDRLHFRLTVLSSGNQLDIFAVRCYATPLPSATSTPQYEFMKDDCPLDQTLVINASSSVDTMTFSLQAFKFLGDYQYVYAHCEVTVCHSAETGNRCAQGCLTGPGRKRRQAGGRAFISPSFIQTLSQGPFTRSSTKARNPNGRNTSTCLAASQIFLFSIIFITTMLRHL